MRYFVEMKYDGEAYCGWQRQPDQPSVQQTVADALTKMLRGETDIIGAGRTDTGVNASYYVAHFDTLAEFDPETLRFKLNNFLPDDISIDSITAVEGDAHSRFSALEREYTYRITSVKNPFLRDRAWLCHYDLDFGKMQEAARSLLSYSDFTSFAKLNSNNHTNICRIMDSSWSWEEENVTMVYRIRADRFLRNMVRSIVGTLADVGRGRYTVEQFRSIVEAKDLSRSSAGAPPQGLFLSDIVYDPNVFQKHIQSINQP